MKEEFFHTLGMVLTALAVGYVIGNLGVAWWFEVLPWQANWPAGLK